MVDDLAEVEHAALSLRTHWDLGRNPIPSMVKLLEECGIKVLVFELSAFGGLTPYAQRGGNPVPFVILLNSKDAGERQRFTLTHALGHLVLAVDANANPDPTAHHFAGAFLMPAQTPRVDSPQSAQAPPHNQESRTHLRTYSETTAHTLRSVFSTTDSRLLATPPSHAHQMHAPVAPIVSLQLTEQQLTHTFSNQRSFSATLATGTSLPRTPAVLHTLSAQTTSAIG